MGDDFIFLQQVLSAAKNVGDSGQVHTQKDIMWLLTTEWKVHGFCNPIIAEQMTFGPRAMVPIDYPSMGRGRLQSSQAQSRDS